MVRAHRAGAVGDACGLQRARVPRRERLTLHRADTMVSPVAPNGHRTVPDRPAGFRSLRDLSEQQLRSVRVPELHGTRVHVDRDRRSCLDGVDADVVTEPVEVGNIFPAGEPAVRAEKGQRLELEAGRLVVALGIVDDVAALHDAAGHAVVHASTPLFEALDDAHAVEGFHVGRAAFDPVLVREGVEGVGLGDDHARAPFGEGLLPGPGHVLLGELLAQRGEGLRRGGLPDAATGWIDDDELESLAPHHCAEPTASGVARGAPLLGTVRTGDRRSVQSHLASGADRHERSCYGIDLDEVFDQRVVPFILVLVRSNHPDLVLRNLEREAPIPVRGLSRDDDGAVAELHEMLAGVAADVRLLDAARQWALRADGESAGGRRGGSGQHTGCQHEHVVRSQGLTTRVALVDQDLGGQGAATQQLPRVGVGLDAHGLAGHVDANQSVAVRVAHRTPPLGSGGQNTRKAA